MSLSRIAVSSLILWPFTRTALVLPRSAITTVPSGSCLMTAWKRETLKSLRTRSLEWPRPTVITGLVISRMPRFPSGDEISKRAKPFSSGSLRRQRFVDLDWLALFYLDGLAHRLPARQREPDIVLARRQRNCEWSLLSQSFSVQGDRCARRIALDADVYILFRGRRVIPAKDLFQLAQRRIAADRSKRL